MRKIESYEIDHSNFTIKFENGETHSESLDGCSGEFTEQEWIDGVEDIVGKIDWKSTNFLANLSNYVRFQY